MEDVDWSFYLLKSCYLIHKIGRTIAEEPMQADHYRVISTSQEQYIDQIRIFLRGMKKREKEKLIKILEIISA